MLWISYTTFLQHVRTDTNTKWTWSSTSKTKWELSPLPWPWPKLQKRATSTAASPSGSSVHAVTVPFQAKGPDQAQRGRRLSGPWNHWRSIDCQPWQKTISGFPEIRGGQPSDVGRILPKVEGPEHGIRFKNVMIYSEFGENIKLPPHFCCEWKSPSANKNITNTPWWK